MLVKRPILSEWLLRGICSSMEIVNSTISMVAGNHLSVLTVCNNVKMRAISKAGAADKTEARLN